jgi:YggT family protein
MFIQFLLYFVNVLFEILFWAIIARALLSWFPIRPGNPFYPLAAILHQITEPILAPLRRVIPMIGMIDITPIVALVLLQVLSQGLRQALVQASRGGF